uniref:Uncharacterized protein n=1 Tax=Anopheles dirus TaxID=7168 RepID=A0A182NY46_9DIPT
MLSKISIALLVCAATVLGVVHSAPSRLDGKILPDASHYSDLSTSTHLLAPVLAHSEESVQHVQQQPHSRTKRAIIFRPLFVYRQQEIKKQKLKEMRQQQQQQQ